MRAGSPERRMNTVMAELFLVLKKKEAITVRALSSYEESFIALGGCYAGRATEMRNTTRKTRVLGGFWPSQPANIQLPKDESIAQDLFGARSCALVVLHTS